MNYHGLNAAGINRGVELLTVIQAGASFSAGMTAVAEPQRRKRASAAFIGRATAPSLFASNVVDGGSRAFSGVGRLRFSVTLKPAVSFAGRAQYGLRRTSILYHASASMAAGFQFVIPTEIVEGTIEFVGSGAFTVADESLRGVAISFQGAGAATAFAFSVRGAAGVLSGPSELVVEPGVNGTHYFIGRIRASGAATASPSISRGGEVWGLARGTMSDVASRRIHMRRASGVSRGLLRPVTAKRTRRAASSVMAMGVASSSATRVRKGGASRTGTWACTIVNHKWRVTRYGSTSATLLADLDALGQRRKRPGAGISSFSFLTPVFSVTRSAGAAGAGQATVLANGTKELRDSVDFGCSYTGAALARADISESLDFLAEPILDAGSTLWPTKSLETAGLLAVENTLIRYAQQGGSQIQGDSAGEVDPSGVKIPIPAGAAISAGAFLEADDGLLRMAIQGAASGGASWFTYLDDSLVSLAVQAGASVLGQSRLEANDSMLLYAQQAGADFSSFLLANDDSGLIQRTQLAESLMAPAIILEALDVRLAEQGVVGALVDSGLSAADLSIVYAQQAAAEFSPGVAFGHDGVALSTTVEFSAGTGTLQVVVIYPAAPEDRTAIVQQENYEMVVPEESREMRVV